MNRLNLLKLIGTPHRLTGLAVGLLCFWLIMLPVMAESGIRAQDDFYTHVNADWLEATHIPDDLPGMDNFTQLALNLNRSMHNTLEQMVNTKTPLKHHERKLVDLYRSYIDMEQRNELGADPLQEDLALIAGSEDHAALGLTLAELQRQGVGGPLVFAVQTDPADATRSIGTLVQYGLGLPQAVLLGDDARSVQLRALYREHMTRLLTLAGIADAADRAASVLALEQALARIQWSPVENRDPRKTYNLYTAERVRQTLSQLPVERMLSTLGFAADANMIVQQPSYFEAFNTLYADTPVSVWQDYLRVHLIGERAPYLSRVFLDEVTGYRIKRGDMAKEMQEWLRATLFLADKVDMMFGRVYIEHHFSDSDLAQITRVVHEIQNEYRLAIGKATLFSEATRQEALNKLEKMRFYVAYPKEWKEYDSLKIEPDDLIGNLKRINEFDHQWMMAKLSKPVDPDEWVSSPAEVNAFYQPSANKFVLLAAILQPPMFDSSWPLAAQLGGIGFIVGHEIGHGFDDMGSQYDAEGNLRNWWTPEDREKFNAVARQAVARADAYELLPGHTLNGKLELGEILGDLNGLHIAHRAALRVAKEQGMDETEANRAFFEQAARVWRSKLREAVQLKLLETDPHPPGEYRVNGIFPNLDAFHDTYQTQPQDGMYLAPEQRLKIW